MIMAPGDDWDAEKMLQVYILDYMKKNNMHTAADVFAAEANVGSNPIAIETEGGFLAEWWSIFYDMFASRQAIGQQQAAGDDSTMEIQTTENELQSLQSMVPSFEMNQQAPMLFANLENMLGQRSSSLTAARMQLQQLARQRQQRVQRDNRQGSSSMGRVTSVDPTLYGVPRAASPIAGPLDAEMKGVNPMPLKGETLSGADQFSSAFGHQGLTSMLQLPIPKAPFQLPRAQYQQDLSSQVLPHTSTVLGVDQLPSGLGIHGLNPMFQLPKLHSQFQLLQAQHQQGSPTQGVEPAGFSLSHQGLKPMLQPPKLQSQFQMLRAQHGQESTQLLSNTSATMSVDQVLSSLGNQVLNSLQSPKQQSHFQVPRAQHQQESSTQLFSNTPDILEVDQIPSNLGSPGLNSRQGPNPQQQFSMPTTLEQNPQQQFNKVLIHNEKPQEHETRI